MSHVESIRKPNIHGNRNRNFKNKRSISKHANRIFNSSNSINRQKATSLASASLENDRCNTICAAPKLCIFTNRARTTQVDSNYYWQVDSTRYITKIFYKPFFHLLLFSLVSSFSDWNVEKPLESQNSIAKVKSV